jgi:hypothetical protein
LDSLTLVYPQDGTSNVPWNQLTMMWNRVQDPTTGVTYTVFYTKENPALGHWTQASALNDTGKPIYAGFGLLAFAGILGMMVTRKSRRGRKWLGIFLILITVGMTIIAYGCSSNNTDTMTATVTLEPNTQYYWRVTADGPGLHAVSAVSGFKTQQ